MRILNFTEGNRSALVAQRLLTQVEFPFLEELYLEGTEPRLLDLLRAPRLRTLHRSEVHQYFSHFNPPGCQRPQS